MSIVKHYELRTPETRIKMKQLATGLKIADMVYFGYSELAFVLDENTKAILAINLKGEQAQLLKLGEQSTSGPAMRRIISPSLGPVFGYKNNARERFFSPKRKNNELSLHQES